MRYESLDLWRGVACLSVIVYHATLYTQGRLSILAALGQHGVTIFCHQRLLHRCGS